MRLGQPQAAYVLFLSPFSSLNQAQSIHSNIRQKLAIRTKVTEKSEIEGAEIMDGSVDPLIAPSNTSFGQDDDPVKLVMCWVRQSCDECISMKHDVDCSWCPFSSTCVPNPSAKYPLLAPIDYPDICPLGSKERWELRARGLGCNVSTRNFLSVVVAVVSSFVLIGLISLVLAGLNMMVRRCTTKTQRRGRHRGHLGIIFFRGWDEDSAQYRSNIRQQRTGGTSHEEALVANESSPLLRREDPHTCV